MHNMGVAMRKATISNNEIGANLGGEMTRALVRQLWQLSRSNDPSLGDLGLHPEDLSDLSQLDAVDLEQVAAQGCVTDQCLH